MVNRITMTVLFASLLIAGCAKEFDCSDPQIETAFIQFSSTDIDSFVIRMQLHKQSVFSNEG